MESYRGTVRVYVTMSGLVAAADDGKIEFINDSFAQMLLGYKHNMLVGKVFHIRSSTVISLFECRKS